MAKRGSNRLKNKIAGTQARASRGSTEVELKVERAVSDPPKASSLIPDTFTPGTARLTKESAVGYDSLLKLFIKEYQLLTSSKKRGPGSRRGAQDKRPQIFSIDKELVIRPLVKHQMGEVKNRFGNRVKETDLVNSVYNILKGILRRATRNFATNASIVWKGDEFTVSGPGNNFEIIEKIMRQVKKDLRIYAFKLINNTKRKLNQREAIKGAAVLAITGTDVRTRDQGGDIRQEDVDIRDGNVILKDTVDTTELTKLGKGRGTGLQIGHTFGPGLGNITAFAGTPEKDSPLLNLFSPDAQALLISIRNQAIEVDAAYDIDVSLSKKAGATLGKVSITVAEGTGPNQLTGANLRSYVAAVRKIVQDEFRNIIAEYQLSPPVLDQIIERLTLQFIGEPIKPIKIKKGKKLKTKQTIESPVYALKLLPGSRTRGKAKPKASVPADLQLLIAELNRLLEDKIQQNMGKGKSKEILNYRTGRFAKSAKIEALYDIKEKGALGARVKYLKNPYSVFEPGGRLFKPGRDPHRIFGKSIRQLLQERKVAKLRRVKVDLI